MTEALDRGSATPLHLQLEEIFRSRIDRGEWSPGSRIPSENELTREFGVARMTARQVLTRLVDDGLLVRAPGRGTYVSTAKIRTQSPAYRGIREQLEEQGLTTSTTLVSCDRRRPTTPVREALHLGPDQDVWAVERVRSTEGSPLSLHLSFIPLDLAPTLSEHDLTSEQLCVVLSEHYGLEMDRVEERLESIPASHEVAPLLEVSPGSPLLMLEDTIHQEDGTPFEYSRILFRGDKIQLHFTFRA